MRSRNLVVPGFTDPGNAVNFNGELADVSSNGAFFAAVTLRPGLNTINVRVTDVRGFAGEIEREVMFAGDSLFIMALADAKISMITREGNLQAAGAEDFDEVKT